MQRITRVNYESATGPAKELLDAVKDSVGFVPNLMSTMAVSPTALKAYLQLNETLRGTLDAKSRELISLIVAETNGCEYCTAAHVTIGKMTGLTEEQIQNARYGESEDPRQQAILSLAQAIANNAGRLTNEQVREAIDAGLSDADITEVVLNVALNFLTNSFNNVAHTTVDFPAAPALV